MILYTLAYECGCGTRPNWRMTCEAKELYGTLDPGLIVHTWQCQRCGETHVIQARCIQGAKPKLAA